MNHIIKTIETVIEKSSNNPCYCCGSSKSVGVISIVIPPQDFKNGCEMKVFFASLCETCINDENIIKSINTSHFNKKEVIVSLN
jgi:hypothetical protein